VPKQVPAQGICAPGGMQRSPVAHWGQLERSSQNPRAQRPPSCVGSSPERIREAMEGTVCPVAVHTVTCWPMLLMTVWQGEGGAGVGAGSEGQLRIVQVHWLWTSAQTGPAMLPSGHCLFGMREGTPAHGTPGWGHVSPDGAETGGCSGCSAVWHANSQQLPMRIAQVPIGQSICGHLCDHPWGRGSVARNVNNTHVRVGGGSTYTILHIWRGEPSHICCAADSPRSAASATVRIIMITEQGGGGGARCTR
jgi:hypothetical protein